VFGWLWRFLPFCCCDFLALFYVRVCIIDINFVLRDRLQSLYHPLELKLSYGATRVIKLWKIFARPLFWHCNVTYHLVIILQSWENTWYFNLIFCLHSFINSRKCLLNQILSGLLVTIWIPIWKGGYWPPKCVVLWTVYLSTGYHKQILSKNILYHVS